MRKTTVEKHFDKVAKNYDFYTKKRELHYSNLKKLLASFIPRDSKVFEVGCGTGDLLYYLKPKIGFGLDISSKMVSIAKDKYRKIKKLTFSTSWPKNEKYEYIFMSDVIEHLEDPERTFYKIAKYMGPKTIFINTMMNPLWEPIETLYNLFGWKMPEGPHNRIDFKAIETILDKVGMKIIKHDYKLLVPIKVPLITNFANKYLEKYFKKLAFIEYLVAVRS